MLTRCARSSPCAAPGRASGIMTRVCPAAQAKMVAIVRWPRGGSDRGRSPCLVLLAAVEVGALMAPGRGRGRAWLCPARGVRHDPRHRHALRCAHQSLAEARRVIRAAWRTSNTPRRDGCTSGGGPIRLRGVLGRWRGSGDRLPAPRAPARRLRPRPASQDRAPWPRQDSRPLPGAAERSRGDAPRTR